MSVAFFLQYWSGRLYQARQASAQRTIEQYRYLLRRRERPRRAASK
jgi:hypothetical protein